nr:reverse transcriptase domain-containing protein [Tanacetum cinerariifolium]
MKEHLHGEQNHPQRVRIVEEDTGSQNKKSKRQALKRMTYHNHGVWFDDLPLESMDSYDDLKKAFLANFLQQKKCIKDPIEIHHIKQRERESTEDFVQRFKTESRHVKGALKCMRISGFMHGITNPELITRERWQLPTRRGRKHFRHGSNRKLGEKINKMGDFKNQQRSEQRRDKFTLLTKSLKEILSLDKGDAEHSNSTWMNSVVVKSPSMYNGIIGRPIMTKIQAVPSTTHEMLKFLVPRGILTLRSSKIIPLECTMVFGSKAQPSEVIRAAKERIKVEIHLEYLEQTITIGSTLKEEGRKELCGLLRHIRLETGGHDWCFAACSGTSAKRSRRMFASKAKKRSQSLERNKAIQEEVKRLVEAGIMKEVYYRSWLSNPVMVKKHDDNWRMCVDFKDLNKELPKDAYTLLKIDWKVESLCRYPFKCFLDAYKGYHQIKMAKEDEEKTTFITSQGIFCYSKMPFGLKNVGATYQRLVDKAFQKPIGINLKVYVDDMVIKSRTKQEIVRDIKETFRTLREINMKLNPKKCTFGCRKVCSWDTRSVKGKILADFVMERPEDDSLVTTTKAEEELSDLWTLLTDGSSCIDGSGAGLILTNPEGIEFTYALRFRFDATNNEAKYEALIAGLRITEQMGIKNLQANMDSQLVANQVNGSYIAKESGMMQYLEKVKALASSFKKFSIK